MVLSQKVILTAIAFNAIMIFLASFASDPQQEYLETNQQQYNALLLDYYNRSERAGFMEPTLQPDELKGGATGSPTEWGDAISDITWKNAKFERVDVDGSALGGSIENLMDFLTATLIILLGLEIYLIFWNKKGS